MRVIAAETWSWIAFSDDHDIFVKVLCGPVAIYDLVICMTEDEANSYVEFGREFMSKFANAVTQDPSGYRKRRIVDFDRHPGVSEALEQWISNDRPAQPINPADAFGATDR